MMRWEALATLLLFALFLAGGANGQYINGPAARSGITAERICAELRATGFAPGASREGHVLRAMSCSGGGRSFVVHLTID